MSPTRGDRAAPSPRAGEYAIRFADNQVAAGWEQLCAQAVHNTRRAWEAITADPRPKPPNERHHQLKHTLATRAYRGRIMDQWQYEVTGGGRIWYLIDDAARGVAHLRGNRASQGNRLIRSLAGLALRAVEVAGPHRWRWLLVDESSGLVSYVVASILHGRC